MIVGLEAAVWCSLVVLAIFGADWIDPSALSDWVAVVTIFVIAGSYVLGILVDRLADSAHAHLGRLWPTRPVDSPAGIVKMRLTVLREGGALASFVEYQRSRLRIARSTALNGLVGAPAVATFLFVRSDVNVAEALGVGAAVLVGAFVSELVYRRVEFAYVNRLSDAYRLVKGEKSEATRAAAIAYRRDNEGTVFCLVTTKKDEAERWTFPKGRFDPKRDESLADTALREAREEAGVEGRLTGKRLTSYRYPRRRGDAVVVAAFLLETRRCGKPAAEDRTRRVEWFDAENAQQHLARNREAEFADEAARVLREALAAIGESP